VPHRDTHEYPAAQAVPAEALTLTSLPAPPDFGLGTIRQPPLPNRMISVRSTGREVEQPEVQ